MKMLAFSAIVATLASTQALPPESKPPSQEKMATVTVRGCVRGQVLELSEDPGFDVPGHKLQLTGKRSMMRALKEHNGHQEEIVGVLKTGSQTAVGVKDKRGDRGRVYVGVSNEPAQGWETTGIDTSLDIRELKHLGPCR